MNKTSVLQLLRKIIREAFDEKEAFEDEVADLMSLPEYNSVQAFAEFKYENDESTYSAAELQAVARNHFLKENPRVTKKQLGFAPQAYRDFVKHELDGYGIKFIPQKAQKHVRGFGSPINGSNRFAGNHGGTGFTTNFNREPDSGRTWSADDETSLRMHAKKKTK